jgi:23S rRNA (adenine2503-C2)-methyltransferase
MVLKPLLRSLVPHQFIALTKAAGAQDYRARQLVQWCYRHDALSWEQMGNLPRALRSACADSHDLTGLELQERQESSDGTRKFLFRLRDGHTVESVIIPMADHATFCLSTQVGCAMACTFCATARGGLVRNLEAGEIIEQIIRLRQDLAAAPVPELGDRQFNVVFMGMGEPLDNWPSLETALRIMMHDDGLGMSRRRIQVSTSGPAAGLRLLIASAPGVGLTLSLGGSTDQERRKVMPVPGRTTLDEALTLAADYGRLAGRRVTVAWVLIEGRTDDPEQAARMARLLRGNNFKVNLIPMNPLDDSPLRPTAAAAVLAFQKVLTEAGVPAFIRASGGRDIAAACGQLRRRRL